MTIKKNKKMLKNNYQLFLEADEGHCSRTVRLCIVPDQSRSLIVNHIDCYPCLLKQNILHTKYFIFKISLRIYNIMCIPFIVIYINAVILNENHSNIIIPEIN